ncbi:MAG: Uma2 family endonuclease [bacterium]
MTQVRTLLPANQWPRMTYEEYLGASEIPEHTEWVDGLVVEMMSVSRRHAEMQVYLIELLQAYLRRFPVGRVYLEPFQMKPSSDLPGRSPDIMVVLERTYDRLRDQFLEGPADLVIEIISQGSEAVDRGDKFYEYEAGGVAEYWLIDPIREVADFYVLDDRGVFRASTSGRFESSVLPGLSIDDDWLWEPKPMIEVLAVLGLTGA